jgi:hypothetical protein
MIRRQIIKKTDDDPVSFITRLETLAPIEEINV